MAVKYARIRQTIEISDTSDYARPKYHDIEETYTPDEYRLNDLVEVGTTAQTYYLAHLAACTKVKIVNLDATNYVTVTWQSEGNGATNNISRIAAGRSLEISDLRVVASAVIDLTLQANTAAVEVEISYLGT